MIYKGRELNVTEIAKALSAQLTSDLEPIIEGYLTSCLNCEHFREKDSETCGLNGLVPPPTIAAKGCELHEHQIPF